MIDIDNFFFIKFIFFAVSHLRKFQGMQMRSMTFVEQT